MLAALLSFLGGNAFRMIFGEVVAFLNKKQDHALEIERLKLQADLDAAQHARNLEAIRVHADLGVKVIEAQRDADVERLEVGAWADAVAAVGRQTGIAFLDIWNGSIRPLLATIAIALIVFEVAHNGFVLSDWHQGLVSAVLGIFVADRSLARRGK